MFQFTVAIIVGSFALACSLHANTEDRLDLIDAEITTIKEDLEQTKTMAAQERDNAFNPAISVVGDLMGQYGFGIAKKEHDHDHGDHDHTHGEEFQNGVLIREVEFEFRGDVDPYADALVTVALEPHGVHDVTVHLEEAYARIKQWPILGAPPLGLIAKIGRFRTAIGRMGRIHLHNTPQITYPIAMRAFLGEEAYASQGLSLNGAVNPSVSSAVNFFAEGVFLSKLPMQKDGAEKIPSGVGHIWWHQELAPYHYLDVGASSLLGRKGKKQSGVFWLMGGDLHYSYIPAGYGQNPIFLSGAEFYSANVGPARWPMGGFWWAQIRLVGATFLGARYDLAPQEEDLTKFQHGLGGYLTYYTTEFLRFRFGYEHVMPTLSSFAGDHRFMLSMIFILGSHPVEPYFINR